MAQPTEWGSWEPTGTEIVKMFRPAGIRIPVPHPIEIVILKGKAQRDVGPQIPKVGEDPVLRLQGKSRPDLAGLMAETGRERPHAALALQFESLEVSRPGGRHEAV